MTLSVEVIPTLKATVTVTVTLTLIIIILVVMKPKIMMEFRWTCNRRQDMGHQHHTHRPAAQETAARAWPFPFLDKDVTPKRTAVYFTVSSMGMFLLFPSFFVSTRIIIAFYQHTSQGAGFLHSAPPPTRLRTPCIPRCSIGKCIIRDGRGCGLAQAIKESEHGRMDCMSLTETIRMDTCFNNRQGYNVMGAVEILSWASGAQGDEVLGLWDRP